MQSLVPYYIPSDINSKKIAEALALEGISSRPFSYNNFPLQDFLLINGDGYKHHKTRTVIKKLKKRCIDNLSYLHIDAHDDLEDGENKANSYQSFVSGIVKELGREHVNLFSDTLDSSLKEELMFYRPFISKDKLDWEGPFDEINGNIVYVSIDLDCLDNEVHTLFPRKKLIGFNTARLINLLGRIKSKYTIFGSDICGFSIYTDETKRSRVDDVVVDNSLDNVVQIVKAII